MDTNSERQVHRSCLCNSTPLQSGRRKSVPVLDTYWEQDKGKQFCHLFKQNLEELILLSTRAEEPHRPVLESSPPCSKCPGPGQMTFPLRDQGSPPWTGIWGPLTGFRQENTTAFPILSRQLLPPHQAGAPWGQTVLATAVHPRPEYWPALETFPSNLMNKSMSQRANWSLL